MALKLNGARVLVTGGAGMIGSHVVDRLLSEDVAEIVVVDNATLETNMVSALASGRVEVVTSDVRDTEAIRRLLPGTRAIIHLAAVLTLTANEDPVAAFDINLGASMRLMQSALDFGVERFVFASSVAVYGTPPSDQIVGETTPANPRSVYGASKLAVELFARALHDTQGLNYIALRMSHVYGTRLHRNGLLPRFLLSVLDQVDRRETPLVEGHPADVHDIIYVTDVAEALVRGVTAQASDVAVNVVAGTAVTLEQVFSTLLDIYGAPKDIQWQPSGNGEATQRRFNGALAEELLGFKATTTLADGLRALVDWRANTYNRRAPSE